FLAGAQLYGSSLHRRSYSVWPTTAVRKGDGLDVRVRLLAPSGSKIGIASNTSAASVSDVSFSNLTLDGIPPDGSVFWNAGFHVRTSARFDQARLQFQLT